MEKENSTFSLKTPSTQGSWKRLKSLVFTVAASYQGLRLVYDSSFSSGLQKIWGVTSEAGHRCTMWLLLVQEWHIPKDMESGNPNCFKWSIFLSCFCSAETFLLKSQFFWFLGLEWEDSSYFLDVYVQHPEFIHRATSLPLKIRPNLGQIW